MLNMSKNRNVYYDGADCPFSLKTITVQHGLITPKGPPLNNCHINDELMTEPLIFLLIIVINQGLKNWMS